MTTAVYHLTGPDGQHYYLLPGHTYGTWLADGQPMRRANKSNWWYSTGHTAQQITKRHPDKTTTLGYRLRDPDTASAKYPAELSTTDFNERTDDGDDEHAPEATLYERITNTTPGEVEPLDMTLVVDLDGEPAPSDGRTWVAKLPYELTRHTELLHLFPGHMPGFRTAVVNAVNTHLGADTRPLYRSVGGAGCEEVRGSDNIRAWRKVPYEPRQTTFVHDRSRSTGRELKSGRNVEKTTTLEVVVRVGDRVEGATRAEAAAKWDEMLSRLVAEIVAELEPAVCRHCSGTGVVKQTAAHRHAA